MQSTILKLPGANDFFTQEAFKALRTNLQFCGQDIHTVVITSCNENEGKTTITLQLAKSLSELDKRVLVIDADMRKSVMAGRNTSVEAPVGLSEVLTGLVAVKDCLYTTQCENLSIMFAGKYPPNPVELLGGPYFESLLQEARKVYDYVLIDVPPLGSVIDAAVVAAKCDGTILVISDNQVRYRQAIEVAEQLKKSGSKILGVVRNNIKKKEGGYYKKYYKKSYQ
jgi:capsular exopolysaccharide synthesis family protein